MARKKRMEVVNELATDPNPTNVDETMIEDIANEFRESVSWISQERIARAADVVDVLIQGEKVSLNLVKRLIKFVAVMDVSES